MRRRRSHRAKLAVAAYIALTIIAAAQIAQSSEATRTELAGYETENGILLAELKAAEERINELTAETDRLMETFTLTEDYADLCWIVEAEARGEGYEGKLAVAEVVINRVKDLRFGETIHQVIYAPGQFDPVGTVGKLAISEETIAAVNQALRHQSTEALYFMNPRLSGEASRGWMRSLELVATVGRHEFYK